MVQVGKEKVPHSESHVAGAYNTISFRSQHRDTEVVDALNKCRHASIDNCFNIL